MNNKIGKNIKTLAAIIGYILFVLPIIVATGFSIYFGDVLPNMPHLLRYQILIITAGVIIGVIGYISAWLLYGFGQLVDDVRTIRNDVNDLAELIYSKSAIEENHDGQSL